MTNKKSKLNPGIVIATITIMLFFLFFFYAGIVGDLFLIALCGGGSLLAGTATLNATTQFLSLLVNWSK
tara:strand:+ start:3656 stop:3862 length:207 start_codon:yes stop_codon:yes gene_type:complete